MRSSFSAANLAILLGSLLILFSSAGLLSDAGKPRRALSGTWVDGPPQPASQKRVTHTPPRKQAARQAPAQPRSPTRAKKAEDKVKAIPSADDNFLAPQREPAATPLAAATTAPTAVEPPAQPLPPERIVIPVIGLDAPVVPAVYELLNIDGQEYQMWDAPGEYAAGWHTTTATLGVPGNTVLNGHHNIHGSVFGRLIDLQENDLIQLYSGNLLFQYRVSQKMILPEKDQELSVRLDNASWLQATQDERLTLITCWPAWDNSHRLIIVAMPLQ